MSKLSRRTLLHICTNALSGMALSQVLHLEKAQAFIGMRVRKAKKAIIYTSGKLFAWGTNTNGQFGNGSTTSTSSPVQTGALTTWTNISTSGPHSLGIREDGTLWAWGVNDDGELGTGKLNRFVASLEMISSATNWISVSAGTGSGLAVKSDGTLWGWGYNSQGELGLNHANVVSTFTQIGTASDWSSVSCGGAFSLALKTNGTLWSAGNNSFGQLGLGTTTNVSTFTQIGTNSTWSQIAAGADHALALTTAGTIMSWGRNLNGSLGHSNTIRRSSPIQVGGSTDWVAIAAGINSSSFALKADGTLWGFGANSYGQLGIGSTTNVSGPTQVVGSQLWTKFSVGYGYTAAIATDNSLWGWGTNFSSFVSTPVQIGSASSWSAVTVTRFPALAITATGTLWGWGTNSPYYATGLYGNGTTYYSSLQQVGSATWVNVWGGDQFTIAKKSDGTLWGVGLNTNGQLPVPRTDKSSPVQIGTDTDWQNVFARSAFSGYSMFYRNVSSGIKTNGTMWQWGYGSTIAPSQVGTDTNWSQICATGSNICFLALKTDGSIWSWGSNTYGWLGLGDTTDRSVPTQIGSNTWTAISAGSSCFTALRSDGTAWIWGGSTGGLVSPDKSSPVQIGSGTTWSSISVGSDLMLLKNLNGTLWSWNGTAVTQIGTASDWAKVFTYNGVHMAIKSNKTLWVWGFANYGELGSGATTLLSTPVQLGSENKWLKISLGYYSALGIKHS